MENKAGVFHILDAIDGDFFALYIAGVWKLFHISLMLNLTDEPDTDTALINQQQKHDKVINSNNAGDDEFASLNDLKDLTDAALADLINQEIPDD